MLSFSKIFYGTYIGFESTLSPSDALTKLQQGVRWKIGKPEVFGQIDVDAVKIQVLHTFSRSNGTRFEGVLKKGDNGSILTGRFIVSAFTRIATAFFLIVLFCFFAAGLIGCIHALASESYSWRESLLYLAFFLIWLAVVCGFTFFIAWNGSAASKDVDVISSVISEALVISNHSDGEPIA